MKETRFKQTEIGEIPEDWEVVTLEDLYTITSSKRVFQSEWQTLGIPFYRAREIALLSEHKEPKEKIYISNDLYTKYTREYGSISENDILITGVGTLGKVYVVKQNDKFYFKDGNIIWLIWNKKNDSAFIKFLYNTPMLINQVFGNANGSTVSTYTIKNAKETLIPLPPYGEQKNISCFLNKIDTLISSLEELIEKKKNIKQGTMQQLLTGKKRLPGFSKSDKYKLTEIGEIPEDWEVKLFDDCLKILPNNTFSRSLLNNSEGKYNNIHYGDILIKFPCILDCSKEEIPFVNDDVYVNYQHLALNDGDIIIADTAEDNCVGKVLEIFNMQNKKIISGLHTMPCRSKNNNFAPKWLGYFMNSELYHNQLMQYVTGIKVSSISKASVKKTYICIPDKKEQAAITNILVSMDNEIDTLNAKLEKYISIKQGMMQQLLTGKIRLI